MTRPIAAFFRSLVVDPRSKRAIDETRLDWCFEAVAAKSPASRAFCHIRSVLALLRALAGSLPREAAQAPLGRLASRLILFAFVPAVALNALFFPYWASASLPVATLFAALLPQTLLAFLPLTWFYALAWRGRRATPAAVAMGLAFVSQLLLHTVIVPVANSVYVDATSIAIPAQGISDSANEYRGTGGVFWGAFDGAGAAQPLAVTFAVARDVTFAMIAAALALVASRVSALENARRVRWLVVPGVTLAYWVGLRTSVVLPSLLGDASSRWSLIAGMLVFEWLVIVALAGASVWLTPTNGTAATLVDTDATGTGIQP